MSALAWIIVLLIVIIILIVVLFFVLMKNSKSFKKEVSEVKQAFKDALSDGKVSKEEMEKLKKEISEIPWSDAMRDVFEKALAKLKEEAGAKG